MNKKKHVIQFFGFCYRTFIVMVIVRYKANQQKEHERQEDI